MFEPIKRLFRKFLWRDAKPVEKEEPLPSPVELFNQVNRVYEDEFREAHKEVHKKARKLLPLEVRMHTSVDALIAVNIGLYMQSPMAWRRITEAVKRYDDAHQKRIGGTIRTEDEFWDEMGPFLLTLMSGFCEKKGLRLKIADGTFINLVHDEPS